MNCIIAVLKIKTRQFGADLTRSLAGIIIQIYAQISIQAKNNLNYFVDKTTLIYRLFLKI